MSDRATVAVIAGDGIGPEVVHAAIPLIESAAEIDGLSLDWERLPYGAEHYLATGETLPVPVFDHLKNDVAAIFLGALGDPRVPDNEHARDILLELRFKLDLYINFRPSHLLHPRLTPLKDTEHIDFVIFRENTAGSYLGLGTSSDVGTPREEQVAHEIHSAAKVERILRAGLQWASEHEKHRITIADKSNAIPAHHLWRRVGEEVAADFSQLEVEYRYVDALAMELVRDPARFDVIITSNLFGDILSDLGAQLVGGLGVAASANLHPGRAGLFEPVHGSAPPLVGTGQANPVGAIVTGALLLRDLGCTHGAQLLEDGVCASVQAGVATPDLGGGATTSEVSQWIGRWIGDKEGG